MVPDRPRHLHLHLLVLPRCHHIAIFQPHQYPGPCRYLHQELSYRYLLLWCMGCMHSMGQPICAKDAKKGTTGHARGIHVVVVGHPQLHRGAPILRFRYPNLEVDWPNGESLRCCRYAGAMDDPSALLLRHELPHHQVSAGPHKDHGNGGDLCGCAGPPHRLQLAPDAEVGMGPGRGRCGPQCLLSGYRSCSAHLHL
ncbi:hypothetical protein SAY87_021476 [Trapa incisa]|uniref:Uncharacterized protein n=1 Tax=Trapa incisa TaxID=236973 RepID=A0AAN7JX59_9MYRT|nr:hypothetical protein SAY87_021476 [Trapa incisa]